MIKWLWVRFLVTWMGDYLGTGEAFWYITNTYVNSAFYPSGVGRSSTGLSGWWLRRGTFTCVGWQVTPCYHIWHLTLHSSDAVRVLGVVITLDLSLDKHVTAVSSKCFFQLRQLHRVRRSLNDESVATLVHA